MGRTVRVWGYRNDSISQRHAQICCNDYRAQLDGENAVDLAVGLLQKLLQQSTPMQQSIIFQGIFLFLTIGGGFALVFSF